MKLKEKDYDNIIQELKDIINNLGIQIRFEKGDFKGGYCLLKNKKLIVINKIQSSKRKIYILSKALAEIGVDDIYISPKIREIIEEFS